MDMRYEAAPMVAQVALLETVVRTIEKVIYHVTALIARVASFSCPSIAGHSISAVAPDYTNFGGTALGVA